MAQIDVADRIRGGLYGVACGDALGATVEFMSVEGVKRQYGQLRDIIGGGWLKLKPGEWTDDTEMTLAVAEGIMANAQDPIEEIGKRFLAWRDTNPPDIGVTTRSVFSFTDRFMPPVTNKNWITAAKKVHERSDRTAGNGALMRTLPVALTFNAEDEIYQKAIDIASMTHFDPQAGLTCAVYCLIARAFFNGVGSKKAALAVASQITWTLTPKEHWSAWECISFELFKLPRQEKYLNPSGYTVDSLICSLWALVYHESLEDVILAAVNLGGDADTIGAIAGGLAGVYWGYEAIPKRWIEKFTDNQRSRLDDMALQLANLRGRP